MTMQPTAQILIRNLVNTVQWGGIQKTSYDNLTKYLGYVYLCYKRFTDKDLKNLI